MYRQEDMNNRQRRLAWSLNVLDRNKSFASLITLSSSPVGGFFGFVPGA
jgi:hypothetical protein